MEDRAQITVSESFASRNEDERRENVQRAMDAYAALRAESHALSGEEPE